MITTIKEYKKYIISENNDIIIDVPFNKKKKYHVIDTPDYEIRYDIVGDSLQLMWIHTKTNKYKGIELFNKIVEYAKSKKLNDIYAWWCDGIIDGIPATGYFIGMKWGFEPVDGIKFVNKTIGTNYQSMQEARQDSNFLNLWKAKGKNFTGIYKLKNNVNESFIINESLPPMKYLNCFEIYSMVNTIVEKYNLPWDDIMQILHEYLPPTPTPNPPPGAMM